MSQSTVWTRRSTRRAAGRCWCRDTDRRCGSSNRGAVAVAAGRCWCRAAGGVAVAAIVVVGVGSYGEEDVQELGDRSRSRHTPCAVEGVEGLRPSAPGGAWWSQSAERHCVLVQQLVCCGPRLCVRVVAFPGEWPFVLFFNVAHVGLSASIIPLGCLYPQHPHLIVCICVAKRPTMCQTVQLP